jgi:hypothetical protein
MFARGELQLDPSDARRPHGVDSARADTADWPTGLRARRSAGDAGEG